MAGKKENLKALFSNTRTRVIIVFTIIILMIAMIVGIVKFSASMKLSSSSSSDLQTAPSLRSIPGTTNPTAQYETLQQAENVVQAREASKKGNSAIPTIIRTQEFGDGVESIGPQRGEGGLGFETLSREDTSGAQQSLWLQSVKDSNCSKPSVDKVISAGGVLTDIKEACTCVQLKDNGFKFNDLEKICPCKQLKAAGFTARQMKEAGYTAARLRECGFDACEVHAAGFTAQEMKDGGYSDGELKGSGFSDEEIAKTSGLPDGITTSDVQKAGCQVDALRKLRASGVSAAAIRRISGCSAAQLKAAGYTGSELKNAGFSAADLINAGFTPTELNKAGFSARELLNAGVSSDDLAAAGYSDAEIKAAEAELPPGMTVQNIKDAGCSEEAIKRQRLAGVSSMMIRKIAGCSLEALKAGGFSEKDLLHAGFTPQQIKALQDVSDNEIKKAGCDPQKLRTLLGKKVSAKRIHELNGCSAAALKVAGFDAPALLGAGFTNKDLLAAGFTPEQIANAMSSSDTDVKAAGCDPIKLKTLVQKGVSAKRIRDLNGCSADALKKAGFDVKQLADAGFSPQDLLAAGFSPQDLTNIGLNPAGVIAAGRTADCSVASLKAAKAMGVSAATIKQTLGCSAKQLRAAGYTAAELKDGGFTAAELKDAGFSLADLKNAGFSAKDLKNAGFSAKELRAVGFKAGDLKNAGFSAKELKNAGFSGKELREAGYTAQQMKDADFTADQLKDAGFSADAIREAGFKSAESNLAGLDQANLPSVPPSNINKMPSIANQSTTNNADNAQLDANQLQDILNRQQHKMADQQYQQQIQQRAGAMLSAATQSIQAWKNVPTQVYVASSAEKNAAPGAGAGAPNNASVIPGAAGQNQSSGNNGPGIIKAGDVLFAVLDTSVDTDEQGPILATIVSGKLNGAKLIGSFTLPNNADKMVISFNTMSVPGAAKTTSINAYAIDPNTARTALASRVNHHYLSRYGSLFAATFLEGFGNAFQSANTTISIGGTGGQPTNTTISNGVGRSTLENAVIGLATLGKSWGQVAQQKVNRPTTVQLYSGTGIGVLFTQDLQSI